MTRIRLPIDESDCEKSGLLPSTSDGFTDTTSKASGTRKGSGLTLLVVGCIALTLYAGKTVLPTSFANEEAINPVCPAQVDPLRPKLAFDIPPTYRNESARRLSEAVRIPTISYDDNGLPLEDDRWHTFYTFNDWLERTFPDVFTRPDVTLTKVNTLALLTEIRGSDPSLKPLMLTSHSDVVPVPEATLNRWTHPPFEGIFDGEFVWGRGAGDCKTLLVAQYEALSLLFRQGWQPRRSIVLAHGFDEEESTARQGAGRLAEHLLSKYGRDSMLLVVDEGGSGQRLYGTAFAAPPTGEKGYVDVKISVATPGGHSSVPPPHTAIGIMSEIISAIESEAYEPEFRGADDPMLQYAVCASEYAPKFPKHLKALIKKGQWKQLARQFAEADKVIKATISTTQAVDIINGGVKVNALPELVTAVVNHRISIAHSVAHVTDHIARVIAPVVAKHHLTFHPFNISSGSMSSYSSDLAGLGNSYVSLEVQGIPLEPAPRTPTSGGVWNLFSGSLRAVYADEQNGDAPYIVSPFATTGNSDTVNYWELTRSIFRWMGGPVPDFEYNYHTVDEKTSMRDHLTILQWVHTIIQNADAYTGEE